MTVESLLSVTEPHVPRKSWLMALGKVCFVLSRVCQGLHSQPCFRKTHWSVSMGCWVLCSGRRGRGVGLARFLGHQRKGTGEIHLLLFSKIGNKRVTENGNTHDLCEGNAAWQPLLRAREGGHSKGGPGRKGGRGGRPCRAAACRPRPRTRLLPPAPGCSHVSVCLLYGSVLTGLH